MDIKKKLPLVGCCKTKNQDIINYINDLKDHKSNCSSLFKDFIAWNSNSCWFAKNSSKPEYSESLILSIIEDQEIVINKQNNKSSISMSYKKEEIIEVIVSKTLASISSIEFGLLREMMLFDSKEKELNTSINCLNIQYNNLLSIENVSKSGPEGLESVADNILREIVKVENSLCKLNKELKQQREDYEKYKESNEELIKKLRLRISEIKQNETPDLSA